MDKFYRKWMNSDMLYVERQNFAIKFLLQIIGNFELTSKAVLGLLKLSHNYSIKINVLFDRTYHILDFLKYFCQYVIQKLNTRACIA